MKRALALMLSATVAATVAATLAGCMASAPVLAPSATSVAAAFDDPTLGGLCKVGPDGGALVADRGMGGTGIGAGPFQMADRGIGGTGLSPVDQNRLARGKGVGPSIASIDSPVRTTGIVGVITGFASICVDGLEVHLDRAVPVDIDGQRASADALRVGQVVAVEAIGSTGALRARGVSVRREVSGPIERFAVGTNVLIVAGQRVAVPRTAWGAGRYGLGDWVAISGLRAPDGGIVATRLDRASADAAMVRGQVSAVDGTLRIGAMTLRLPDGVSVTPGQFVAASGVYRDGAMRVGTIGQDILASSPPVYFGASANKIFIQSIVRVEQGKVLIDGHVRLPVNDALVAHRGDLGNAVVALEKGADGTYSATGLRQVDGTTAQPAGGSASNASTAAGVKQIVNSTGASGNRPDWMLRAKTSEQSARVASDTVARGSDLVATSSSTAGSSAPAATVAAVVPMVAPPVVVPAAIPVSVPVPTGVPMVSQPTPTTATIATRVGAAAGATVFASGSTTRTVIAPPVIAATSTVLGLGTARAVAITAPAGASATSGVSGFRPAR